MHFRRGGWACDTLAGIDAVSGCVHVVVSGHWSVVTWLELVGLLLSHNQERCCAQRLTRTET